MDDASQRPIVVAAVMTYNRKESLRRCLQGISTQTVPASHVLVVDNASTDGTQEMLSRDFPEVRVHRTGENLGCAGAMREALRQALDFRPDYIWFFDDDVIAAPSCLEALLLGMRNLERDRRVGVLRPMVRDPESGDVVGGGTSHASLLRAEMVRTVEPPKADLFIELSDRTYNAHIRRSGFEILRLPAVLAEHPVNRPKHLREILADGYRVKPWRLYYAVRNRIYLSLYEERSLWRFIRQLGVATGTLILLTFFGRPKRGHALILRGIADGMLARLGRRVNPSY